MNLKQFKVIAPTLDKEIADVFAKFGLKVGKRGATVDEATGTISFRLTLLDSNLKDKDGNATTPEAERYKRECMYVGLDPAWLGVEKKHGSKTYKVVGLRAGRSSKPVMIEINGKPNYIMPTETVRQIFGLPKERSLDELRAAATGNFKLIEVPAPTR